MARSTERIGFIEYDQVGMTVHQMINRDQANGIGVVFVQDIASRRLKDLPDDLVLQDLGDFDSRDADLVVEMAHADVTRQWGTSILAKTDYLFISVTALANHDLEQDIQQPTHQYGTRAFIPHGGVAGMDALLATRDVW